MFTYIKNLTLIFIFLFIYFISIFKLGWDDVSFLSFCWITPSSLFSSQKTKHSLSLTVTHSTKRGSHRVRPRPLAPSPPCSHSLRSTYMKIPLFSPLSKQEHLCVIAHITKRWYFPSRALCSAWPVDIIQ